MKNTVRLNFEFPRKYYPFLKMICAQQGQSFKDFASNLLIRAIEEYEERELAKKAGARLSKMKSSDLIDFGEAMRLAGWNDVQN